jgi:hypothetical protein
MDRLGGSCYRQAVEDRIRYHARTSGISPKVLRRRFALERLAAALDCASQERRIMPALLSSRKRGRPTAGILGST